MTAQAEVFAADLVCETPVTQARLGPREVQSSDGTDYYPFLDMSLTSQNYTAYANIRLDQRSDLSGKNYTAAHLALDRCGNNATSSSTKCMILVLASYAIPKNYDSSWRRNNTGTALDDRHINISALLCEPHYSLERTKVNISPDGRLLNNNLTFGQDIIVPFSIPSWDLAVAFNTSLSNSAYMYPTEDLIRGENADYATFLLASAPGLVLRDLLDPKTLANTARAVFRTTCAQIARRYLTLPSDSSDGSVAGTTTSRESRLHVQETSLRIIEGSLIILLTSTFCVSLMTSRNLRLHIHPSLVGIVEVLSESPRFIKSVTGTGSWSLDEMLLIFSKHSKVRILGETRRGIHVEEEPRPTDKSLDRETVWWSPFASSSLMKSLVVILPMVIITSLEITLYLSGKHRGFGDAPENNYAHCVWTLLPAGIMTTTKLLHESAGFLIELLDPYNRLKQGAADIRTTLVQNHLHRSSIEVVCIAFSTRRFGTAAIALSILSAPFLAIFASGLFSIASTSRKLNLNVTTSDRFDLVGMMDPTIEGSVSISAATISAANLLVDGMIDSPSGTFGNFLIPQIASGYSKVHDKNATQNTTVQIRLPVLRPNLTCNAVPRTQLKFFAREVEHDSRKSPLWYISHTQNWQAVGVTSNWANLTTTSHPVKICP